MLASITNYAAADTTLGILWSMHNLLLLITVVADVIVGSFCFYKQYFFWGVDGVWAGHRDQLVLKERTCRTGF